MKSRISEISNFKIILQTRTILKVKALSSNFTKTVLINGYFYNSLEHYIREL